MTPLRWKARRAFGPLIGAAACIAPVAVSAQTRLTWRWTAGVPTRFTMDETTVGDSVVSTDSTKPGAVRQAVIRRSGIMSTLSATERGSVVVVRFESSKLSMSGDGGAHFSAPQDVGLDDSALVRLTPAGQWEEVHNGKRMAAGYAIDELNDLAKLTLPLEAVSPGDEWPVHIVRQRDTRPFGRINSEFTGRARLDSMVGGRAWMIVDGVDSAMAGSMPMAVTTHSVIEWNVEVGAPESVLTDEAIVSTVKSPKTGQPETVRMRTRRTVHRLPAKAATAGPVP